MHKNPHIPEFNVPEDDIECWNRYPKQRWVYDLSRLLDAQHIKWSPYTIAGLSKKHNMNLESRNEICCDSGIIYTVEPLGQNILTEVYIVKGEIKFIRHIDKNSKEMSPIIGEVELRLNAFVTLYFQKFTGVISVETIGNEIFNIKLRPSVDISLETNQEIIKLIKRIYKKSEHVIFASVDITSN